MMRAGRARRVPLVTFPRRAVRQSSRTCTEQVGALLTASGFPD